jgi:Domain of unknown function (DUF1961)
MKNIFPLILIILIGCNRVKNDATLTNSTFSNSVGQNQEQDMKPPKGEIIWNNNLNDISDWMSDGKVSFEHLDSGVLRIFNESLSVYWVGEVFEAPVILDFDVRTQDENTRAILFFMAEGVNGEDVFSWARPEGDYGDYAFYGRMQLYTVGMMREGLDSTNNFRILHSKLPGHLQILKTPYSELAEEQKTIYAKAMEEFQPFSIKSSSNDDYVRGEWQHYQIFVDSSRIRVWAEGKLLHDVIDNSLRKQGRIGFRNFRPNTAIEVRNLQAIRP